MFVCDPKVMRKLSEMSTVEFGRLSTNPSQMVVRKIVGTASYDGAAWRELLVATLVSPHAHVMRPLDVYPGPLGIVNFVLPHLRVWAYAKRNREQLCTDLRGLLSGLAHLHAHGWTHGDVKPENAMLTDSDTLQLIDFGCSRRIGEAAGEMVRRIEITKHPAATMGKDQAGQDIGRVTAQRAIEAHAGQMARLGHIGRRRLHGAAGTGILRAGGLGVERFEARPSGGRHHG
jgi:hypothetical protein